MSICPRCGERLALILVEDRLNGFAGHARVKCMCCGFRFVLVTPSHEALIRIVRSGVLWDKASALVERETKED